MSQLLTQLGASGSGAGLGGAIQAGANSPGGLAALISGLNAGQAARLGQGQFDPRMQQPAPPQASTAGLPIAPQLGSFRRGQWPIR